LLTRPPQGFGQPALLEPDPRLQSRDGTHIGQGASNIHALRLIKQSERAIQVSLRLFQARLGNAQAMRPIRRRGLLAQLLAGQQVLRGGFQVAPFNVKLTEAAIQVCRSEGHGLALAGREA
jgi:hypothetical protein